MFLLPLCILTLVAQLQCSLLDTILHKVHPRKRRGLDEYDDNIFMFRNPNITIPLNRTRLTIVADWLYGQTSPRTTMYYGQRGLTREWTTYAWYNDRVTVYLDTFLRGLKKAPWTDQNQTYVTWPSTTPKTTTLSDFEKMTLYDKKDLIFKLPWAYLPHKHFREEMGFGPNDTIDMSKVKLATIQKFEKKYKVTVMHQWPNTHHAYLDYINRKKYRQTLVLSEEMSTQTPLNLSLVDFEEWFYPQVPRMKLGKVENLEYQLRVMLDDVFDLPYLDKHIFQDEMTHGELQERYNRFRRLRKREYRTWYRRKIYIPWKHMVKDGIRNWFFNRGRCVPTPGKLYFDEVNKQFESLSADLNETIYQYFYEFENSFLHWYAATYGPRWNMSLEEEQPMVYTRPTLYSPVTEKGEFYLYERPGILCKDRRRKRDVVTEPAAIGNINVKKGDEINEEPGVNGNDRGKRELKEELSENGNRRKRELEEDPGIQNRIDDNDLTEELDVSGNDGRRKRELNEEPGIMRVYETKIRERRCPLNYFEKD
ncbi:hypothetical protein WDU94_006837 [Cyamophila willieti]